MNVFTDNRLVEYVQTEMEKLKQNGVKRSRFCQKDLFNFLQTNNNKVCGIYGLRRTGKSTLMLQTIASMDCQKTAFIQCTQNDSYIDVERMLDVLPQRYIFIDEITKADNFIQLASSLSDKYINKRIVITGTDSASLLFTKQNELYDRILLIPTTYISFAEYKYLLDKSLEEYIEYGGTLTDGKTIYNSEENLEEYTNTAIISNICKSVKCAKDDNGYQRLYTLYQSGNLEPAINKTIEKNAKEFSLRVMTGIYNKSNLFGSAKDLILKQRNSIPEEDIDAILAWKDHTNICRYIMKKLSLGDSSGISQSDIDIITNFLVKLDVLNKSDKEIFFTQPGMQYCFAEALLQSIVNTQEYQMLYPQTQRIVLDKIRQDCIGHILEHVIRTDIVKHPAFAEMQVGKLDNTGDGEFDLYILDQQSRNAAVYEIKRSFSDTPNQYQHLINDGLCNDFENMYDCTIVEKAVLYQGESKILSNGIKYYNASDFLLHLQDTSDFLAEKNIA